MSKLDIYDNNFQYYLHGTNNTNISSFFNDGLISNRGNSMFSTMYPISKSDIEEHGFINIFKNYTSKHAYNYCYIIKIPKNYLGYKVNDDYSIEPPIPFFKSTKEKDYVGRNISIFTPHLIAGVYINNEDKIVENTNFNTIFDPTGLQYSREQIDNMNNNMPFYDEWLNFANIRNTVSYEELCNYDIKNNNWERIMNSYSEKLNQQTINK